MHVALIALLLAAAPDAAALRQQATDAFRAKRYAEACPLFAQASAADPKNGEIFADLGLCWDKAGDKAKAQAADLQAAVLGDATTRLHAYFNLGKLGRSLDPAAAPDAGQADACRTWTSDVACSPAQTLSACSFETTGGGSGGTGSESGTAICAKELDAMRYSYDDPNPACTAYVDLITSEIFCGATSAPHPHCDEDPDSQACKDEMDECEKTANTEQRSTCVPVFADACQLRVGVVCDGKAFELSAGHSFDVSTDQPEQKPKKKPGKKKHK